MATLRLFTWQDVEAKGQKPWTTQQTFSREINTESMSETAAAYARAAGEAKNVDHLAEEATQVSQEAGNLNGAPLVRNGRFQETHRALQRGGSDMDNVVRHIIRGMNHAIDAEKECHQHVNWMNRQLTARQQAAQAEWRNCGAALTAAAHGHTGSGSVTFSNPADGKVYTAQMTPTGGTQGSRRAELPQDLADDIRNKYLNLAVGDARHAQSEIRDTINGYRHKLAMEAAELAGLGYDLTKGPLGIFSTPQMARWTAGRIASELGKKDPDTELIENLTKGLESIAADIFGDAHYPGKDRRDLTAAERAYLWNFYDALGSEGLAKLGALEKWDIDARIAKMNVANGISMLLNPEIGGYAATSGSVPPSLSHFVNYAYGEGVAPPGATNQHPKYGFELFNGFGGLIGEMTVKPHDELSTQLARSAVNIEKYAAQNNAPMTGSSGMLTAAALNSEATAQLLGNRNDPFYRELLSQSWDDDSGVARYVESGTTPPKGMSWNDPGVKPYVNAGFNVLQFAAQNPDSIKGLEHNPHSTLHKEIGDTTVRYLDMLSRSGGPTAESGTWKAGDHLNGTDYAHGFNFSHADRNGLFSLMNDASRVDRANFFGHVATWEYNTALEAFRRGKEVELELANIGTIAGAAEKAQSVPSRHYEHDQRWEDRWTTAKYVFDAAGSLPVQGASTIAWPFKTAAELQAQNLSGNIEEAKSQEQLRLTDGEIDATELLIADAAVRAGYGNAETAAGQRPSSANDAYNVREYVNAVMGNGTYKFRTNYNEVINAN